MRWCLGPGKPRADFARGDAALIAVEHRRRDEPVVGMIGPVGKTAWHRLPGWEVDHVHGAGRHDLRNSSTASAEQPVRPAIGNRTHSEVAEFAQCKIHDGSEGSFGRQSLESHAAHAGCVEHRHFETARLKGGLQRFHESEARRAKAHHADDRPATRWRFHGPRRAKHRTRRLAER